MAVAETPTSPAFLIAGLGNWLLRDDGIGVHAVRQLMGCPMEGTLVMEVGTDVFSAVRWLESVPQVLAIDAMDAGGPPGTIYQCASRDIKVEAIRASLHELCLLSVLEFVPKAKWPEITVLGVQPGIIDYGLELSPALQEALPKVVAAAQAIVAAWQQVHPDTPSRVHWSEPVIA